jgi:D-alanyl-D-alanine carboxypeptidase
MGRNVGRWLGATAAAAAPAPHPDLQRELQGLVGMPDGPPRATVVVQRGGRRSVSTAGVSDLTTRRPARRCDHMRLASAAKVFSGAVALSLVSQDKLSLNDTIVRRLPWLPAAWDG